MYIGTIIFNIIFNIYYHF